MKECVKKKFDISIVLAKEHTPFPAIHELKEILLKILFATLLRAKDNNFTLIWHVSLLQCFSVYGSTKSKLLALQIKVELRMNCL